MANTHDSVRAGLLRDIRSFASVIGKAVRHEAMSKSDYNFNVMLLVVVLLILLMGLAALGALMMFLSAFM